MADEKNKAIRIEMEFEDGRIQRLSGEDAERWLTAADAQCTMGWVHGMPFPEFTWEVVQEGTTPQEPQVDVPAEEVIEDETKTDK